MGVSIKDLAARYPILYHMAEDGSWPSIMRHGLLSASKLLDMYQMSGEDRRKLEELRRPEIVVLEAEGLPEAALRDNKPMTDADLLRCLQDGLTPADWYRLLNERVFFWLSAARLETLLGARAYRDRAHHILQVDTASLVTAYSGSVRLSAMNSGATKPVARPRGLRTFLDLNEFPFDERVQRRLEPAVELAVIGGVPDIADFTLRVERRAPGKKTQLLWKRQ